jgi:hypothetical protein
MMVKSKTPTTKANTKAQKLEATTISLKASPWSCTERENNLSIRPATKRNMENISSWGIASMIGPRCLSASRHRKYISVTRLQASCVLVRVRDVMYALKATAKTATDIYKEYEKIRYVKL